MHWLTGIDWKQAFLPQTSLLEIFLRGTLVYLGLFTILRVVLKRQRGGFGVSDLLVIVLIADAAQNAMAGNYTSVPDGIMLVVVIVFWALALDWLGYHFPAVQRFVHPPALVLFKNGDFLRHNLKKEFITQDELESQLRLQGIESLEEVDRIYLEGTARSASCARTASAPDPVVG